MAKENIKQEEVEEFDAEEKDLDEELDADDDTDSEDDEEEEDSDY